MPLAKGSIEVIDQVSWPHDMPGSMARPYVEIRSNHKLLGLDAPVDPVLIGNGYGEKKWSEERALERAAEEGVSAVTARPDVEHVPATVADVFAYGTQYMPRVARYLLENHYSPQGGEKGVDATGESMTGALLGLGLRESPDDFDGTIFSQPAGHDVPVMLARFPDDDERRDDMLQRRFPKVVLWPYTVTHEGGRGGTREASVGQWGHAVIDLALGQIVPDIFKRRINPKFDSVVSPELLGIGGAVLDHAADGHRVGYIFGGKDPLILRRNVVGSLIIEALADTDRSAQRAYALTSLLEIETVPDRRHAYMGFPAGLENLSLAFRMLGRTAQAEDGQPNGSDATAD